MFKGLINDAKSAAGSVIAKYLARASVVVPFVIAFGFATAALTLVLVERFGAITASARRTMTTRRGAIIGSVRAAETIAATPATSRSPVVHSPACTRSTLNARRPSSTSSSNSWPSADFSTSSSPWSR